MIIGNPKSGSDKTIWLKANRSLPVISHTSDLNRRIIRVHESIAREICLLPSQNPSLRLSTSSMQPLQANMENAQEKARPQVVASFAEAFGNSPGARADVEKPCAAHRSYASSVGAPFSPSPGAVRLSTSHFALAQRTAGPRTGRIVLSVSGTPLGFVFDGCQAAPSKSSRVSRSCAPARAGECALLVAGVHDDSRTRIQTHLRLGIGRHSGHDLAGWEPRLDCAVVPFSPHQPVARQPRPTKAQIGGQTGARDPLPAHSPGARTPRRYTPASGAQAAGAPRPETHGVSRHAHGRARVSEEERTFQSLSQISEVGFAKYHRHRRGYGTKSPGSDAPDSKHQQPSRIEALGDRSDPDASNCHV